MKTLLTTLTLVMTLNANAEITKEFDENTERKCHQEMKAMGCVKGDSVSQACAETNKKKLSVDCKLLHEARKTK